jgi:hypothetical protein
MDNQNRKRTAAHRDDHDSITNVTTTGNKKHKNQQQAGSYESLSTTVATAVAGKFPHATGATDDTVIITPSTLQDVHDHSMNNNINNRRGEVDTHTTFREASTGTTTTDGAVLTAAPAHHHPSPLQPTLAIPLALLANTAQNVAAAVGGGALLPAAAAAQNGPTTRNHLAHVPGGSRPAQPPVLVNEEDWEAQYTQIKKMEKLPEEGLLYDWLFVQKIQWRKFLNREPCSITQSHIDRLSALGLKVRPYTNWDVNYTELLNFYHTNGYTSR